MTAWASGHRAAYSTRRSRSDDRSRCGRTVMIRRSGVRATVVSRSIHFGRSHGYFILGSILARAQSGLDTLVPHTATRPENVVHLPRPCPLPNDPILQDPTDRPRWCVHIPARTGSGGVRRWHDEATEDDRCENQDVAAIDQRNNALTYRHAHGANHDQLWCSGRS